MYFYMAIGSVCSTKQKWRRERERGGRGQGRGRYRGMEMGGERSVNERKGEGGKRVVM